MTVDSPGGSGRIAGQPGAEASVASSTSIGSPNAWLRIVPAATSPTRPAATARPPPSTRAWPNPGGISSTWCDTRTMAAGEAPAGEPPEVAGRASRGLRGRGSRRARRGAAGRGPASAPGRSTSPALAGRQRPERVVRDAAGADLVEQPRRAIAVCGRELVPPRPEGRVPGGHHDVDRREARVDRHLEARAGVADPAPQLARVDPAVSSRRGPRPCRWSATGTCWRPGRASSCPSRSGRGRPSARRHGPSSRAGRGSSGRRAGPRRR